jgi:hypothetical protein
MRSPRATGLVAAAGVALLLWFFRPLVHGPAMLLWTAPLVWLPPVLVFLVGVAITWRRRRRITVENIVAPRSPAPVVASAVVAIVLFLALSIVNGPLSARALYEDIRYTEIARLPSDATVRILPKQVAQQIASSGFNSPTEFLTDFAITRTPDGLQWSAIRTPDGLVRTFTKRSQGIVTLDAENSARSLRQVDADFHTAPRMLLTDNLRWKLLKRHYFVELGEAVGVQGADGPLILVPYIEYRGVLVRRPRAGGVFVVHPGGRIEDLEPEEARRRPELAATGRLFPERLARRIQDAYAYKRGIWNRFFVHEEQTQITDTEANQQPYLIDFGDRGARWVSVAEPYGRAFAANAVFLTDTLTGRTQVWPVPRGASLSGNRRALDTVRSVSIPGVTFGDRGAQGTSGGRFRAVEPRPVFVGGKLLYLVSIVPESGNSVSKSVIVDAQTNKVVQIFNTDTDPQADAKTLAFLRTGTVPTQDATPAAEEPAEEPETPAAGSGGDDDSVAERLDALIRRQRQVLRDTEALREQLRRDAP